MRRLPSMCSDSVYVFRKTPLCANWLPSDLHTDLQGEDRLCSYCKSVEESTAWHSVPANKVVTAVLHFPQRMIVDSKIVMDTQKYGRNVMLSTMP